jgi:4-hydroxy-tetrahydrodipicolinate reductase
MGQAIVRLARSRGDRFADLTVTGVWARDPRAVSFENDADIRISDNLEKVVAGADILIDFSLPAATETILDTALRHDVGLVSGVSGLDEHQLAAIDDASDRIPLLYDRNMSQGIAVLDAALREVVTSLGVEFTIEIQETHHVHKKDAPSGTALRLGESIDEVRGGSSTNSIHYESQRIGEVPGDHKVILTSPSERLEFSHSALTRDVFAEGALVAARWLAKAKSGRYSMRDVLFGD